MPRWRRSGELLRFAPPVVGERTYSETVEHILGPPGQQRLTPSALWYAHDISWRPFVAELGPADGPEGAKRLEELAGSHGFDLDVVLDEASRARRAADRAWTSRHGADRP